MWRWTGGWGCCGGGLGFGWWGILNIVFSLIFLAAIIVAVIWVLRRLYAGSKKP